MDIKIGPKDLETTFHYVNISIDRNREKSEHTMIAGNIKMQEAVSIYQTYDIDFLCLTKDEKNSLLDIFDLSGELNLQLEDEDFLQDHTVKFSGSIKPRLSRKFPGYWECSTNMTEVS